ncbi:MAG: PHP-associated domain-containing protein [bacterium]
MIIDLHVHTRRHSGCSLIEPMDLIARAGEVGLDGVALTEHGILWQEQKLAPLRERAGASGLVILAGEEVTCLFNGRRQDFLVFGLKHSLGSAASARELIEQVHGSGGIIVAAHPFKPSRLGVGYHGIGDDLCHLPVDAVESHHPDHDAAAREKARRAATRLNVPTTGGSDAHELRQVGLAGTRFMRPVRTVEDLVHEIRAGRVEPVEGHPQAATVNRGV